MIGETSFVLGFRLNLFSLAKLINYIMENFMPECHKLIGFGGRLNPDNNVKILMEPQETRIFDKQTYKEQPYLCDGSLIYKLLDLFNNNSQVLKLYQLQHDAQETYGAYAVLGQKIATFDVRQYGRIGFHGALLRTTIDGNIDTELDLYSKIGVITSTENFGIVVIGDDCECCT